MNVEIPSWAVEVLRHPIDGRLRREDTGLLSEAGTVPRIDGGLVFLTGRDQQSISAHSDRFAADNRRTPELLSPSQAHFRSLLERFLTSLPRESVVAEIAAADAEFFRMYRHLRYLPMDLSVARLRRAQLLDRITFGIVADIRALPMNIQSADAIVCTNTLNHLPIADVPAIVVDLISRLKRGGRTAITVPAGAAHAIEVRLRKVPCVGVIRAEHWLNGPISRWWRKLGGVALRAAGTARWTEAGVNLANRVASPLGRIEADMLQPVKRAALAVWLEIEAL